MKRIYCLLILLTVALSSAISALHAEERGDAAPVSTSVSDSLASDKAVYLDVEAMVDNPEAEKTDSSIASEEEDDPLNVVTSKDYSPYGLEGKREFNPDPTRAVWMSALFPGLGQVYNRRYWKLPIVVGGFMGLGYATSWNNNQLTEYTQAYRDLMDSDPATNSYMNFFPSTTKEEDLDKTWLANTMKSRRDFYRRNRDLCIICCVGLYLLCMIDAYVDASLAHFDISPDLSIEWSPAMIVNPSDRKVSVGLNWAFNF